MKAIDITGHRFGHLVALDFKKYPNETKGKWRCLCDCGKEKRVTGSDLRKNKITTCGCKINSVIEEKPGTIYGYLKVLEKDPKPAKSFHDNCIHWFCICQLCGRKISVSGKNLRNGNTKSCGCMRSQGEQVILEILEEEKIPYKKEVSFSDLNSIKNAPLRFDFGIYEDFSYQNLLFLIEFQGELHFMPFNKTEKAFIKFKEQQENDQLKEDYVGENKLVLLSFIKKHLNPFEQKEEIKKEILYQLNRKKELIGGEKYGRISYYELRNI